MNTTVRKLAIGTALVVLALPVIAQAPKAISIIVNGVPLQGKALNYKGRLYVPLEDVAAATGGTFTTDPATGVVTATVPMQRTAMRPPGEVAPARPDPGPRPFIKVLFERKYVEQTNAQIGRAHV